MKTVIERVQRQSSAICTFWLRPEEPVRYAAGQFIELTLQHDHPDDRGEKRWFTLSSAPNDPRGISITTKYAGDERSSSFKKALFALKSGAELQAVPSEGDFMLPEDQLRLSSLLLEVLALHHFTACSPGLRTRSNIGRFNYSTALGARTKLSFKTRLNVLVCTLRSS